jgi:hypothetical protein
MTQYCFSLLSASRLNCAKPTRGAYLPTGVYQAYTSDRLLLRRSEVDCGLRLQH